MAFNIGELVGFVKLDTSGVTRGAAVTSRTMRGLGNDMDTTGRRGIGFGSALLTGAKYGAAGLAIAGAAGATMGLKTAAGLEQAKIAFTTMLGSGKKADAFLQQLSAFAAKTPFEFPELQTAASSLISAGINANKVIPIMTTLGDVTSGMGTGSEGIQRATVALQQMNAAGKITGEDLNQLRDAGIPVYDLLAKATGKSKAQVVALAQAGKLGGKELGQMMKALETGKGLERFSGLMKKQSQSLTGIWSTFMDTLNMGLAKAITPLIPAIKQGLGGATTFLAAALPVVISGLSAFAGWLARMQPQASSLASKVAGALGPAIRDLAGWFRSDLLPALQKAAAQVLPALRQGLSYAGQAFVALRPTLTMLGKILTSVVIPVLAFLLRAILPQIGRNLLATAKVISIVVEAFRKGFNAIKSAANAVANFFSKTLPGAFSRAWSKIKSVTSAAVGAVVGFVKSLPGKAVSAASALGGLLRNLMTSAWEKAKSAVVSGVARVVSAAKTVGSRIVNGLSGIPGQMLGVGKSMITGLMAGIKAMASQAAQAAIDVVKGALDGAKRFLHINSPSRKFAELGKWSAKGFAKGIRDHAGEAAKAASDAADKAIKALQDKINSKRDALSSLLSNMASIKSTVADAFTPDLFAAGNVTDMMAAGKAGLDNLNALAKAKDALLKMGAGKNFLTKLFQSGNSNLILDLASGSKATLSAAQTMFASTNAAGSKLGGSIADNALGGRVDKVRDELVKLRQQLKEAEKKNRNHDRPLIGQVHNHGHDDNTLAEKLWYKTRTRG